MAKAKFSGLISELRGKVGGLVGSRNRYGPYLRRFAAPVQPRTPAQSAQRAGFSEANRRWSVVLTAAVRAAWEDYASQTKLVDNLGESFTLSGNAMYTRFNAWWYRVHSAFVDTAPVVPGEAPMLNVTLTGSTADGIKITAFYPTLLISDEILNLKCAAPVSQAKNFFAGPFTNNGSFVGNTAVPITIVNNTLVAIGQRWFFQFRAFQGIGKVGPTSRFYVDIMA